MHFVRKSEPSDWYLRGNPSSLRHEGDHRVLVGVAEIADHAIQHVHLVLVVVREVRLQLHKLAVST